MRVRLCSLNKPLDTSAYERASDDVASVAIESARKRLLAKRSAEGPKPSDQILSALRRLTDKSLAAYHVGKSLVLSEPFNAIPNMVQPATAAQARSAIKAMLGVDPDPKIVSALRPYGVHNLRAARKAGVRIRVLYPGERFAAHSEAVSRLVPGIDDWGAPPSGLYVVEERRLLVKSVAMRMTFGHEFAHALDGSMARRERSYFSYEHPQLRSLFGAAPTFINEYAASGLDEFFAEAVRAYLEINDDRCVWRPLTRVGLRSTDPRLFSFIEQTLLAGGDPDKVDAFHNAAA